MDELPFHRKDLFPKSNVEQGLFCSMILGILLALSWEFLVVIPSYYPTYYSTPVVMHILLALFTVYSIFGNLHMLKRVDVSGNQKEIPNILRVDADVTYGGWNFCHTCNQNSPPRAYHCYICDECVLKRSHHCKFAGCCVGYHNQRYYIMAVLYFWIGAIYAVCFQWSYCLAQMGGSLLSALLALTAPHIAWIFGVISTFGFIAAVMHILAMLTVLFTSYLLGIQLFGIYSGQTEHERKAGIKKYNFGWKQNFLDVFGTRWYLIWLSPWISSPQLGDGINFSFTQQIKTL